MSLIFEQVASYMVEIDYWSDLIVLKNSLKFI